MQLSSVWERYYFSQCLVLHIVLDIPFVHLVTGNTKSNHFSNQPYAIHLQGYFVYISIPLDASGRWIFSVLFSDMGVFVCVQSAVWRWNDTLCRHFIVTSSVDRCRYSSFLHPSIPLLLLLLPRDPGYDDRIHVYVVSYTRWAKMAPFCAPYNFTRY